jgi:nitroreductase
MNVRDAIFTRRSVRQYSAMPVDRAMIEQLLLAATQAPSATNAQTWAFGIIQGAERLRAYGERAKAALLREFDNLSMPERYREMLSDPNFHIFYDAPALIIIYATPGLHPEGNCCLAAENLMLAAWDVGLGTCWIGFAQLFFNSPEAKKELGVPTESTAVAPLIVGYPAGDLTPVPKNPPAVLYWK